MESVQTPASSSPNAVQTPPPVKKRGKLFKVFKFSGIFLAILCLLAAYLLKYQMTHHMEPTQAPAKVDASGDETLDGIRKGIEFLRVYQEEDGGFSRGIVDPKPAFTALVVDALARAPLPDAERKKNEEMLGRAAKLILSKQHADGSICTSGMNLDVYSTAISLMALKALGNPAYADAIEKSKNYLLSAQKPPEDSNPNSGGVGYGTSFGSPDGGNTAQWVEALKEAGVDENSEAFKNAQKFLTRLQNDSEQNHELVPEGVAIGNDGGFAYKPGEGKGRDSEGKEIKFEINRDGKRVPKSYGMMSYAGLKSFIYMHVDKKEARVQSAWKWVRDNYTLDENKNIGADGLFYNYMTMAKALAAYGEPVIETTDGKKHEWARELAQKLLNLQRPDGSWSNDKSSRWMENDRVMVTAFAIRSLAIARDFYTQHPADGATKKDAPVEAKPVK